MRNVNVELIVHVRYYFGLRVGRCPKWEGNSLQKLLRKEQRQTFPPFPKNMNSGQLWFFRSWLPNVLHNQPKTILIFCAFSINWFGWDHITDITANGTDSIMGFWSNVRRELMSLLSGHQTPASSHIKLESSQVWNDSCFQTTPWRSWS